MSNGTFHSDEWFLMPLWQLRENHFSQLTTVTDDDGESVAPQTLALCIVYGLICLFGLLGNARVLGVLTRALAQSASKRHCPRGNKFSVCVYVLCLCVVDTVVLALVPLIVADMIRGEWPAGRLLCRLYPIVDGLCKLLSSFILVAFSGSCCLAACSLRVSRWHNVTCVAAIAGSTLAAILMVTPVVLYSDLFASGVRVLSLDDGTFEERFAVVGVKCLFHPPTEHFFAAFVIYTVSIGFGLTGIVQIGFYTSLVARLLRRRRVSAIPFAAVVRRVILLVSFYFVCWTPYWLTTIYTYVREEGDVAEPMTTIISVSHLLPYLNSAVNPTLYARLLADDQSRHVTTIAVTPREGAAFQEATIVHGGRRHSLYVVPRVATDHSIYRHRSASTPNHRVLRWRKISPSETRNRRRTKSTCYFGGNLLESTIRDEKMIIAASYADGKTSCGHKKTFETFI